MVASHIPFWALGAHTEKAEGGALDAFGGSLGGFILLSCHLVTRVPGSAAREVTQPCVPSPIFGLGKLLEKLVSLIKALFWGHHGKEE